MENHEHDNTILQHAGSIQNQSDLNRLFLIHLGNIYRLKKHLTHYLPKLSPKVTFKPIKLGIINTSIKIQSQMLRLDIIYRLMDSQYDDSKDAEIETLNLERYMNSCIEGKEILETTFAILSHLLVLESIAITSSQILLNLAAAMGNKNILYMVKQSLKEGISNKKALEDLERLYLTPQAVTVLI